MSDLSNLLGDVYGDSSNLDGPPVRHEAPASERVPEWSEDSRLDKAFADWQPESHGGFDNSARPAAASDSALADALSAALSAPAPAPAPVEVAPAPVPVAAAPAPAPAPAKAAWTTAPAPAPVAVAAAAPVRLWQPGDDDIFPMRGRKR